MHALRHKTSPRAGFTLLELLLVMVILAIMVAIVAPSLSQFAIGRKTNYAAMQLVAMAKYARAQAMNEGRTYRLNFDTSAKPAVWLTIDPTGQNVSPTNSWGNKVELADGLTLRADLTPQPPNNTICIDFHPDGRTGDGPAHVWISDKQGRVIEIACLSPTELFRALKPDEMTNQ